jgi:hypothetical protein
MQADASDESYTPVDVCEDAAVASHGDDESSGRFLGGSSGARMANMPQRSRAFVSAISAGLCGLVGLLLGGYGVDLVRLQRPDFEYGTLLAAAIIGGLGWCAGAIVAWPLASARPVASRADVALLVLGAVVVLWFGVPIARSLRYAANLGPMIDEGSLDEPLLPVISVSYFVDVIVAAITLVGLAASRLVACRAPTAR